MTIPNSSGFLYAQSCLPCTPEEEKSIIQGLDREAGSNRKKGDSYYLVSSRWWNEWEDYVGLQESPQISNDVSFHIPRRPGRIDNSELLSSEMDEENNELLLREGLMEEIDFKLVPQEVWKKLDEW
ncbi:hypothetical protein Taro_033808 [Colocasia esculenta]|uniref:DUSP domain-containing protein n=1 Tax=Colocasia esculenta TaxID=4460 RepID=A0A843WDL0_COLES|nr:hypothetical protein [Colocasia esculenta]